jgi:hypothetical protein
MAVFGACRALAEVDSFFEPVVSALDQNGRTYLNDELNAMV